MDNFQIWVVKHSTWTISFMFSLWIYSVISRLIKQKRRALLLLRLSLSHFCFPTGWSAPIYWHSKPNLSHYSPLMVERAILWSTIRAGETHCIFKKLLMIKEFGLQERSSITFTYLTMIHSSFSISSKFSCHLLGVGLVQLLNSHPLLGWRMWSNFCCRLQCFSPM